MNDDETWSLDDLLDAAKHERAPASAEARGWERFEHAVGNGAAGMAAQAAGVAPPASPIWITAAKLGAAVAVVVTLGLAASQPSAPAPVHAVTPVDPTTPAASPIGAVESSAIATPPPAELPISALPTVIPSSEAAAVMDTRSARARGSTAPPSELGPAAAASIDVDALRAEAELLGRAWLAIREGRPADTMALVAEHTRRFPEGALIPERRACELVARCARGERAASGLAQIYLREHGSTQLAARVRLACAARSP